MLNRLLLILMIFWFVSPVWAQTRLSALEQYHDFEVLVSEKCMVITNSAHASDVAIEILKKGGNAMDAAIAANAVLGFSQPFAGGIGGDLVALIYHARGNELYGMNASGRSPSALTRELFVRRKLTKINNDSPLSITVPGCVDGWFQIHQKFGRLPENEILAPAIRLAEGGVVPELKDLALMKNEWNRLNRYPDLRKMVSGDDSVPDSVFVLRNSDLATTYKNMAINGFRSFYSAKNATLMAESSLAAGGVLKPEDIMNHQSEWVLPLSITFDSLQVYQLPPNQTGLQLLEFLMLYEKLNDQIGSPESGSWFHNLIELKKIAAMDMVSCLGDPTYRKCEKENKLHPLFISQRSQLLDTTKAAVKTVALEDLESQSIAIVVADEEGNLVVLSQNNHQGMGSGIVPKGMGFVLQNRACAFSLNSNDPNFIGPLRRPPIDGLPCVIMFQNKPVYAINLADNQLGVLAEGLLILRLTTQQKSVYESISKPLLIHNQLTDYRSGFQGGWVTTEKGVGYSTVRQLIAKGQRVKFSSEPIEGLQLLHIDNRKGTLLGVSRSTVNRLTSAY